MNENHDLHVKISEFRIGQDPDVLKATLGSCVGIAILWKRKNLFGLAHCLLPSDPQKMNTMGARYVSQAIPTLLKSMQISPVDFDQLEIYLAGGGNMISELCQRDSHHIGLKNAEEALRILKEMGLKVTHSELGGVFGRTISVDCSTGHVYIRTIPQADWKKKEKNGSSNQAK